MLSKKIWKSCPFTSPRIIILETVRVYLTVTKLCVLVWVLTKIRLTFQTEAWLGSFRILAWNGPYFMWALTFDRKYRENSGDVDDAEWRTGVFGIKTMSLGKVERHPSPLMMSCEVPSGRPDAPLVTVFAAVMAFICCNCLSYSSRKWFLWTSSSSLPVKSREGKC